MESDGKQTSVKYSQDIIQAFVDKIQVHSVSKYTHHFMSIHTLKLN